MFKKLKLYFSKHPMYNALVHLAFGTGLGIILARPVFTIHPLRYGFLLLVLGLFGHLAPGLFKLK